MTVAGRYSHLFRPLRVGPVTVANRVVFGAHRTDFAEDGLPSARHTAYYAARARGGAGLVITEAHATHPTDGHHERLVQGYRPEVLRGYRAITESVHRAGVPVLVQLAHIVVPAAAPYVRRPAWAASPVADPVARTVPKAVERHEISAIIDGYARAAELSVEGGFDGVELQCAHPSIVAAFLSPATNRRDDRYGGPLANRARLLLELIGEVRGRIGPARVLGVRLCGDELLDGGSTLADAVELARVLQATGKVDYLGTALGTAATRHVSQASMHIPAGYALHLANAVRRAVDLPVIGEGRFTDPLQADRALADGHCDLVSVVRGQIADPEFAAKARAGFPEAIRGCLSCNQGCVPGVGGPSGEGRLACAENPRVGRESEPDPAPAAASAIQGGRPGSGRWPRRARVAAPGPRPRDVLVAGAGPAGLQAAIAAARAGHRVRVCEAADAAGGQVRLAAAAPGRAEFGELVRNQLAECRRRGVVVDYGTAVDAGLVRLAAPDVLVVATGARPERPAWAGGLRRVVDVRDVLSGAVRPSGSVLVVDGLGFHEATGAAEFLAERGCSVEIVTPAPLVGRELAGTLDLEGWSIRAAARGIAETCEHRVTGAVAEGTGGPVAVSLEHEPTGTGATRTVDWMVCALPQAPRDELYRRLRSPGGPAVRVLRAGDCVAPRRVDAAVADGERIGGRL
ncbi:oxidoreductase [Marinitenerispora sediminis]|uniref:oxidoreductase n=1 Tax=Marinitenerispora sediminis TaxID=1931232 RepID=UPI000DF3FF34|nr:FAD-dependent oxidoreductase [Marinitenerispora sediminis]RCV57939.1 mycofactocin system FadH/OYE family oxidoreductase 2 [Marinitenerispora sediminis]RCV62328.1 mycofactocin system FadH/OYE family oxidoreductase 2 [Marinitenerispora sediminis]